MRLSHYFSGQHITVYSRNRLDSTVIIKNNQKFPGFASQALVFNSIKNNNFLLEKMFEISTFNKHGLYLVKINQNGHWKYVIVDDYVPVIASTDNQRHYGNNSTSSSKYEMAFMSFEKHPKEHEVEIWPYLLQKAYAKYYGTYESL